MIAVVSNLGLTTAAVVVTGTALAAQSAACPESRKRWST
jgi:hypothetical protein